MNFVLTTQLLAVIIPKHNVENPGTELDKCPGGQPVQMGHYVRLSGQMSAVTLKLVTDTYLLIL